jgi:hypothetical protein
MQFWIRTKFLRRWVKTSLILANVHDEIYVKLMLKLVNCDQVGRHVCNDCLFVIVTYCFFFEAGFRFAVSVSVAVSVSFTVSVSFMWIWILSTVLVLIVSEVNFNDFVFKTSCTSTFDFQWTWSNFPTKSSQVKSRRWMLLKKKKKDWHKNNELNKFVLFIAVNCQPVSSRFAVGLAHSHGGEPKPGIVFF